MSPLLLFLNLLAGDIFRLIWILSLGYLFLFADSLPRRWQQYLLSLNRNLGPLLFLTFPSAVLTPFETALIDVLEEMSFGQVLAMFEVKRMAYTVLLVAWGWWSVAYLVGKNLPSKWPLRKRVTLALAVVPCWSVVSYLGLIAFKESVWKTEDLHTTPQTPTLPVSTEDMLIDRRIPLDSLEAPLFMVAQSLRRVDDLRTAFTNVHVMYCDLDSGIQAVSQKQPLNVSPQYRKRQRLIDCNRERSTSTLRSGFALERTVTVEVEESLLQGEALLGEMLMLWFQKLRPMFVGLSDTTNDVFRTLDRMPEPSSWDNALVMLAPKPPGMTSRLTPFGLGDWWYMWYVLTTHSNARVLRQYLIILHRDLSLADTYLIELLQRGANVKPLDKILHSLSSLPSSQHSIVWGLTFFIQWVQERFSRTTPQLRVSSEELVRAFDKPADDSGERDSGMASRAAGFLDGNGVYSFRVRAPAIREGSPGWQAIVAARQWVAKGTIGNDEMSSGGGGGE